MSQRPCSRLVILLAIMASLRASSASESGPAKLDFEHHIAPLLVKRCVECHHGAEPSGGLSLATEEGLREGGDSGPAILMEAAEPSRLIARIVAGEMPPEKQGVSQRLPDDDIGLLTHWAKAGAPWPDGRTLDLYERTSEVRGGRDWWSLQPIERRDPPNLPHEFVVSQGANPIDAFILDRLSKLDMEPAPLAGKRQLIRRIYFDLFGLPPSFDEVEAFVADQGTDAWERLVDRLLASPQYGERWGRYWLDLVRFAETCGYERDQELPYAWRYRDWVIDALNNDMPFDRFVLEQLAGDELSDRNEQTVIATGLLRLGTWNDEPNEPQDYKYERLEDLVHVASSAFLGLTVKCARCHDHKFDPIPQTDYYRVAAAFWPGAIEPRERELLGGPSAQELGYENVLGWTDLGANASAIRLLKHGDRNQPGELIEAGTLSAIPILARSFDEAPAGASTTARRLQLARWIVDPQNPLPARVYVNRLWQGHFGAGLVRTPNNFGFLGDQPTHRELLDWLADELVEGGWSAKRIHKLMLMSRTYRQSSDHPRFDEYSVRDAANRLCWRAERRRLDAEALRDAMLTVTNELDATRGGPSFRASVDVAALEGLSQKEAAWKASPPAQQLRRSVYMFAKRSLLTPMMTTFNFCDTVAPCGQRDVTTEPTQALALMNSSFAHDRSRALALRVVEAAGSDARDQARCAWRFVLGRIPELREESLAANYRLEQRRQFASEGASPGDLDRLALESLCHVLLNSNEFLYVD